MKFDRDRRTHYETSLVVRLQRSQESECSGPLTICGSQIHGHKFREATGLALHGGIDSLQIERIENVRPIVGSNRRGEKSGIGDGLQRVETSFHGDRRRRLAGASYLATACV